MAETPREILEIDGPEAAARVQKSYRIAPPPPNFQVVTRGTPPAFVSQAPHAVQGGDKMDALLAEFRELKDTMLRLIDLLDAEKR